MQGGTTLEPIPWVFTELPSVLMWTWHTPQFLAKITAVEGMAAQEAVGDGAARMVKAFTWEIGDLLRPTQGMPRVFIEGMTSNFTEAESRIREHIGKAYSIRYGFLKYAGNFAFTFTIATGEIVDFTRFMNTDSTITMLEPDGTERRISGMLSVSHYKIRMRSDWRVLEIRPEHIIGVENASEVVSRALALRKPETYSGIGRMHQANKVQGCTGVPGYLPNTVDHTGCPSCPVHETNSAPPMF